MSSSLHSATSSCKICECCQNKCSVICTHRGCNYRTGKSKKMCNNQTPNITGTKKQETYYSITEEIAKKRERYQEISNETVKKQGDYWKNMEKIESATPQKQSWGMQGIRSCFGCQIKPARVSNDPTPNAAARIVRMT